MWTNLLCLLLGIWMIASPSVLESLNKAYSDNSYISGAFIATFSIISIFGVVRSLKWIVFLAGIWLLVSFWIFSPGSRILAMNSTLVGFITAILSLIKTRVKEQYGGGWSELK